MSPGIADILAIVSLLITILTFFFNLSWASIDSCLSVENPPAGRAKERERQQQKIMRCIWRFIAPIFCCLVLLAYVNFPTFYKVVGSSKFSLWDFDVTKTLFCFMEYALFVFILVVARILFALSVKYRELK